jgi:N-methylhydantoinase B
MAGAVYVESGRKLRGKGQQTVPHGERVVIAMPGGGGLGHPWRRDIAAVANDVRLGLVSPLAASRDYGVVVDAEGTIDHAATDGLRAAAAE